MLQSVRGTVAGWFVRGSTVILTCALIVYNCLGMCVLLPCRQGIARGMLEACDTAARQAGQDCIWLHVRKADAAAQQLYAGYAYQEQDRDKPKAALFGFGVGGGGNLRPRILMRRQLS